MCNNDQYELEEYKSLRAEVTELGKTNSAAVLPTITATAVILGYAFANQALTRAIYLVPLIFIIPIAYAALHRSRGVNRIGAYLHVFHEIGKNRRGWSSRNSQRFSNKQRKDVAAYISTDLTYIGLGALCLSLYLMQSHDRGYWKFTVVAITGTLLLNLWICNRRIVSKARVQYLEMWTSLYESENGKPLDGCTGSVSSHASQDTTRIEG